MGSTIRHFRELDVYTLAVEAAMGIFQVSKSFPAEERYSLTDQVRRSSRSVCANIGEAWRKRRYPAAFLAKLSDAEAEAAETEVWLDIAARCGYISQERRGAMEKQYEFILGKLVNMMSHPEQWTIRTLREDGGDYDAVGGDGETR